VLIAASQHQAASRGKRSTPESRRQSEGTSHNYR
jgi:hypothetical protein